VVRVQAFFRTVFSKNGHSLLKLWFWNGHFYVSNSGGVERIHATQLRVQKDRFQTVALEEPDYQLSLYPVGSQEDDLHLGILGRHH